MLVQAQVGDGRELRAAAARAGGLTSIEVVVTDEVAGVHEALAQVTDGPLHLALGLRPVGTACSDAETAVGGEAEELGEVHLCLVPRLGLEAHQRLRGRPRPHPSDVGPELRDAAPEAGRPQLIKEPDGGELRILLEPCVNDSLERFELRRPGPRAGCGISPVSRALSSCPCAIQRLIVRRFTPTWRAMAAFGRPWSSKCLSSTRISHLITGTIPGKDGGAKLKRRRRVGYASCSAPGSEVGHFNRRKWDITTGAYTTG
jgi:hypothetical protein